MTNSRPIRVVTAAALFDGHDATINMIRRLLQDAGAEVIHLGHNRSVFDVANAALQECAQGICVSSYQGGHMEYFKYLKDLLRAAGAPYIEVYGGGGGVIIHDEKRELEAYGIAQIFHPDDGRKLGLDGMTNMILSGCDFDPLEKAREVKGAPRASSEPEARLSESRDLGLYLQAVEMQRPRDEWISTLKKDKTKSTPVLGMTGTGGAGKSSLIDELAQRFLNWNPNLQIGVLCVDPSKRKTGGSLLGDRIRINSLSRPGVFMRSIASRGSGKEISHSLPEMVNACRELEFDLVIAETSGIGQGSIAITEVSDLSLYVMTSDFGAQSQLEKIDMIDFADLIAVNKADRRGALDAVRDVKKQWRRSRKLFHEADFAEDKIPVYLTQASRFNDEGIHHLFFELLRQLQKKSSSPTWQNVDSSLEKSWLKSEDHVVIPPDRQNYLAEIAKSIRDYKQSVDAKAKEFSLLGNLESLAKHAKSLPEAGEIAPGALRDADLARVESFEALRARYKQENFIFEVRDQKISQPLYRRTLSGSQVPRVIVPKLSDWGDRYRYLKLENVPGEFPYTAGVFSLKRPDEEPKRMFAGEGPPEKTNRRFHYLCEGETSHRLSTAFDSVTLYGNDPHPRPDIYGKVGESGVSVCSLEDMKRLYDGFDLCAPTTSVSMTINGPAPMILAFFFNAAIDQQVEKKEKALGRKLTPAELAEVRKKTLSTVRGTVQADILKEDQGQNTCIFSTGFALKMMGDIQSYFIDHKIRNFYSVSISGYHIAEAGANPLSQLAFTLANGFTFVEYYLSRGMKIDDFAPNLSFFFSNGLDAEYTVLGRVARRIWAIAMRDLYGANDRSQKLKYHIQTSGRSLHAQEIAFNDIRTTLQALTALADHCNSLHTNAYDEAITTPTEESVRRAMAIQMIINREFGVMMNENPNQGSYLIEYLTDLVEEAVLSEFLKLNERGGVLGAMETQYQRSKIQEESLSYETLKHSGELPLIGVNTFVDPATLKSDYVPLKIELARATPEEKKLQLTRVGEFQNAHSVTAEVELKNLKNAAIRGGNVFEALMSAARVCSLGQMTKVLFEAGGEYRRNL